MNLFDWDCVVIDGHDYKDIFKAFDKAASAAKPTMILANTIKGKGVSFMENEVKWHHTVPSNTEVELARQELLIDGANL